MGFSKEEIEELKALAASDSMRSDTEHLRAFRFTPFFVDGEVDCDRVVEFLDFYNEFLNHPLKKWTFMEKNMKL